MPLRKMLVRGTEFRASLHRRRNQVEALISNERNTVTGKIRAKSLVGHRDAPTSDGLGPFLV